MIYVWVEGYIWLVSDTVIDSDVRVSPTHPDIETNFAMISNRTCDVDSITLWVCVAKKIIFAFLEKRQALWENNIFFFSLS